MGKVKAMLLIEVGVVSHRWQFRSIEGWISPRCASKTRTSRTEANEKMKSFILNDTHQNLIDYKANGKAFELAIPTPEHYLPMLYAMALKDDQDEVSLFNDEPLAGSLTMTSVKIMPSK